MSNCRREERNGKGRCCCNCEFQVAVFKHPWNEGEAKGRITELFGWACSVPDFDRHEGRPQVVFLGNREHSVCEMHDYRKQNNHETK